MSESLLLIDGLTHEQFKLLLYPVRDIIKEDGSLSGRKVTAIKHGLHLLENFFIRLFAALFVTHQWESDASLQQHLLKELTRTEKLEKEKIKEIRQLFHEILLRIPQEDPTNIKIQAKLSELEETSSPATTPGGLEELKGPPSTPVELDGVLPPESHILSESLFLGCIQKLNHPSTRVAERNKILNALVQELIKEKFASVPKVLQSLIVEKDRMYLKTFMNIFQNLGSDHPFLSDFVKLEKIYIVNSDQPQIGVKVLKRLLQSLGEDIVLQNLSSDQKVALLKTINEISYRSVVHDAYKSLYKKALIYFKNLKLSKKHPIKMNEKARIAIFLLNHQNLFPALNPELLKQSLVQVFSILTKPVWKEDLIELLTCKELKRELKIKAKLLKEGDLVCQYSQEEIQKIAPFSGLNNDDGKHSSSSICAEAILSQGFQNMKTISSEEEMYHLIKAGIQSHKLNGFGSNPAVFSDVVEKINSKKAKLTAFAPKPKTFLPFFNDTEIKRYKAPLQYPFEKKVKEDFLEPLNHIKTLSDKNSKKIYGVVTCGQKTVMTYVNQDGSYSIFDPSCKEYLGISKGASILKCENIEMLDQHLQGMFAKDETYSMLLLGQV